MNYTIAIDIGGTCTDCVAMDSEGGFHLAKTFSTPPDFSTGILNGLKALALDTGQDLDSLLGSTTLFLHSTTVAENAIVDGTMARAGLITTSGFEDTLRTMRGGYGRWSGLSESEKRDPVRTDKPPELIPRSVIRGIHERTGSEAESLSTAEDTEIERAVSELLAKGIESVAVCLLWSFLRPEGEQRVGSIVRRLRPDMFITLSHELAPVIGEYERTATTALNARLGPVVTDYLDRLQQALIHHGFAGTLLVMQAYGGLLPLSEASSRPIGMIESGPVGGVLGSKHVGELVGARNVIAADMGGTTFKVGVVRESMTDYESESMALRYHFAVPKLDIASLGLAGGSVINVDPVSGVPSIGPRSAGSFPGPVCYGNGGRESTLTDIDAILGYLHPDFFLGGETPLHIERARDNFDTTVAKTLGMTVDDAAPRIYRLANSLIGDMLHKATVQRGIDPREFSIISIGGTAGMHVGSYGAMLGVERIIIPNTASVHSATGLLHSNIVHEEQVTRPLRLPVDATVIDHFFQELADRVKTQLHREGFGEDRIRLRRSIDMRYARQTHVVTVPVEGPATFDLSLLEKTLARFEELYRGRYGRESGYRDAGIELISFRLRGIGEMERPDRHSLEGTEPVVDASVERRRAWVDDLGRFEDVEGYAFDRLRPGDTVHGPAIVWATTTTIVLRAADIAEMDQYSNLTLYKRNPTAPDSKGDGSR